MRGLALAQAAAGQVEEDVVEGGTGERDGHDRGAVRVEVAQQAGEDPVPVADPELEGAAVPGRRLGDGLGAVARPRAASAGVAKVSVTRSPARVAFSRAGVSSATTRPWSTTTTRSASASASSR